MPLVADVMTPRLQSLPVQPAHALSPTITPFGASEAIDILRTGRRLSSNGSVIVS